MKLGIEKTAMVRVLPCPFRDHVARLSGLAQAVLVGGAFMAASALLDGCKV